MGIPKNEFLILSALREGDVSSQRALEEKTGLSIGTINAAYKRVSKQGLADGYRLTEEGRAALRPYKVDNAVIMAAGLSSRFAPISYEKPKGLLEVRGEVLIERQIRQLREAGIDDIYVVVGYKKEYFFYLEDKFGVTLVVNDEYAKRNNHSSLMAVIDELSNTYVCSSDDYFVRNPFEPFAYEAYYATEYREGKTDEWCVRTGSQGRIVGVSVSGADSLVMLGHAYFDKSFSEAFSKILKDEYDNPETEGKLWEALYCDHIKELRMVARVYEPGVIYEFDTLDELRLFDPQFINNVDSEAFDNIVSVLGCSREEIRDVYPLKQGLTNLSCHFRTNDGEYVYRHPGVGTEKLIDREEEMKAQQLAKELGLDDTFIYENPEKGWKISRFIPNCKHLDTQDDEQLRKVMQMASSLHESKTSMTRHFDFFEEGKRYERLLKERSSESLGIPGYEEMAARVEALHDEFAREDFPKCLCHNDFFELNFLVDEAGKMYLIDWEYAGLSDPSQDFGTFTVCCQLSEERAEVALEYYFGRKPTDEERRHNFASVCFAGWCWYVWSLYKEAEGEFVGEWLYVYYRYAKRYLDRAEELYGIGEQMRSSL